MDIPYILVRIFKIKKEEKQNDKPEKTTGMGKNRFGGYGMYRSFGDRELFRSAGIHETQSQKNETSVVSESSDSQSQPETSHGSNQEKSHDNAENNEDKKSVIVYKTKTGNKYHRDGCLYLSKSKIAVTLEEAENEKLEPCKSCFGE